MLHTHTYIYLYLSNPSINPPLPPTSPTEAIHFSTCFLCALKGSWGGCFCIERLSINVPFDRYHTKQIELGRKKKRTSHSFPLSWRYIKCCTRKTVYEKVFFFQTSYIMKEVRCIHLTNLYSLCEQVARSSTPSTKQKLNQLKLFYQKGKVISPQFQKNGIRRMWFFNLAKIGNLYYVNTDQLQYVNNHISAS